MDEMSMISSWDFEVIVRDLLGEEFNRTERWWNRKGEEVDMITINDRDRIILFGEVKWTNRKIGERELDLLKERSEKVDIQRRKYLVVSRSGFRKNNPEDDRILWDMETIDKEVKRFLREE